MIIKKIEERMNLSLGSYSKELSTIRTGRANPKMLDGVRVELLSVKIKTGCRDQRNTQAN